MTIEITEAVTDLETNMRALVDDSFAAFQDPANVWWQAAANRLQTGTKKQIIKWFLSSAKLSDQGSKGGRFDFSNPTMLETEFSPKTAGAALEISRQQFDDIDGNGMISGEAVDAAAKFSKDMGHQFAKWPQEKMVELIEAAESEEGYDNVPFFDDAHPCNGVDDEDGTYANLLVGSSYRIDGGVTADVAMQNLAKVYKAMRSVKHPTGQSRLLRPAAILAGPALFPTVAQRMDAKFLAVAAASGGGSMDFTGYTTRMGFGKVIEAPELLDSEWDSSYIVLADRGGEADLGAFVYVDREPFSIRYYTGRAGGNGVDAALDISDILRWQASGRNTAGFGHPFLAFKVKA